MSWLDVICRWAESAGLSDLTKTEDYIEWVVDGAHDRVVMAVLADDANGLVGVYAQLDRKVPAERRVAAAELLARANFGQRFGNFELDFDDGEVRFKDALHVRPLSPEQVVLMLDDSVANAQSIAEQWARGVALLVEDSSRSAEQVAELVESGEVAAGAGAGGLSIGQGGEATQYALLMLAQVGVLDGEDLGTLQHAVELLLHVGAACEQGADADELAARFVTLAAPRVLRLDALLREGDGEGADAARSLLQRLELPFAAVLSRSQWARALARREHGLIDVAVARRWDARFLHRITHVLDGEELLVLHRSDGWGFRVVIGGISDNWQLHALLADTLHDALGDHPARHFPALAPDAAACMRGLGPQQVRGSLSGVWDLYNWTAIANPDEDEPPMEPTRSFIWGEGVPADIVPCPALDGRRVVLLAPPSYGRGTHVARDFEGLRAAIAATHALDAAEVSEALATLAAVPEATKREALLAHSKAIQVDL